MPKAYIMVGVPAFGKSYYINNVLLKQNPTAVVISTDNLVEQYAHSQGKTYSDVFQQYMPAAVKIMTNDVITAVDNGMDIIWDQTSTTIAARKKKLRMLPADYEKIAVVLSIPGVSELAYMLFNRPGKNIPDAVMKSMIAGWQYPSLTEGFNEIINV